MKVDLIVLGSSGTGKTSLTLAHANKAFPSDYTSEMLFNHSEDDYYGDPYGPKPNNVTVDGNEIELMLWEQQKFAHSRGGSESRYRNVIRSVRKIDVPILTVSVVDPKSLTYLKEKMIPDLKKAYPEKRFIIAATKIDLRNDEKNQKKALSFEDGLKFAQEVGAACYMECSAMTLKGVPELIEAAIKLAVPIVIEKEKKEAELASEKSKDIFKSMWSEVKTN